MAIRINYAPNRYAEWNVGSRTINAYAIADDGTHINYDCASFGYDKPDNSTTQIEMLAVLMRHIEDVYPVDEQAAAFFDLGPCPACGDHIDYCQGHGRISDPLGYHIVRDHHDFDKHDRCHAASDCREDN